MTLRKAGVQVALLAALAGATGVVAVGLNTPRDATLAAYSTSLIGRTTAQRHNADLAVRKLNGAVVEPGAVFSFNKRVGTWSRDVGYRRAPVSYNGTLIESWGGGVCQTSTTLYNAAMLAGMELVERNPHRFAPDYVPPGRDAAVAFDNIDLKFRNPFKFPVKITGDIQGDRVVVGLTGSGSVHEKPQIVTDVKGVLAPRVYRMGWDGGTNKLRNDGKRGWEVATYRIMGKSRELLSTDSYPAMNKIVEGD